MLNTFLVFAVIVSSMGLYWSTTRKMFQRVQSLERDLQRISDVVGQLAEIQMRSYQKSSVRLENMDERIMELSVPSQDSSLPLERRHQVLALARQGVGLEDIVQRLKAPVGEAELILNLRKYMGGESSPAGKMDGQVKQYA
jgi:hypothetical protein